MNYQERIGAPGACIASPVAANGRIFLSAHNGTVRVIEAGKNPSVIGKTKLQGNITASPAITDNSLYYRTSEYLYTFVNLL